MDYRVRRSQILPVFQFDSTSIPEADWIISLPEPDASVVHESPFGSDEDDTF